MKIESYPDEPAWKLARAGRITGTRLGSLFSKRDKKPLKSFFEVIAERVAIPASEEAALSRGKRLEERAMERFSEETGKKICTDLVIWSREDDSNIAISPDGYEKGKKIKHAYEAKCLNSASHIEALLTKQIPSEYEFQVLQYFIVCDDLETLTMVFFDDRMPKDLHWITVTREQVQPKVEEYLALEREALKQIAAYEQELTF